MSAGSVWTGVLRATPEGLRGELRDPFGWVLTLAGETVVVDGRKELRFTGTLGETPAALRLPGETVMRDSELAR